MTTPAALGEWPSHCQQRAFVDGARWLMMNREGREMRHAEQCRAERQAVLRYGDPLAGLARPLTDRQLEILRFIKDYIDSNGTHPTVREIGARFLIGSPNGVASHLRSLLRKRVIAKSGRGIISLTSIGIAATKRGDA